jgi:hypothetical protein
MRKSHDKLQGRSRVGSSDRVNYPYVVRLMLLWSQLANSKKRNMPLDFFFTLVNLHPVEICSMLWYNTPCAPPPCVITQGKYLRFGNQSMNEADLPRVDMAMLGKLCGGLVVWANWTR